ncbi:MAG: hypothetical protein QM730_19675 [Anaerolineales bacterium]
MAKKPKRDPVTGYVKQPIGNIVVIFPSLYFFLTFAIFWFPYISLIYLYVSLLLGFTGMVSIIWLNYKPNLWMRFLYHLSLTGFFALIAERVLGFILRKFFPIPELVIITSIVFANILPIWNPKLTQQIKEELFAPRTSLGKTVFKFSVLLFPIAGTVGAAVGLLTNKVGQKGLSGMIIAAPIFWFLALILPFSTRYAISPWQYNKLKTESTNSQID